PDHSFHQVTAIVHLADDGVSFVAVVSLHRSTGPVVRARSTGEILQNVTVPVVTDAGHDDPCFVASFLACHGRIDGHHDTAQLRRFFDPQTVDGRPAPQRPGDIV